MSLRTLEAIPDIKALHWPRRNDYIAFNPQDSPHNAPSNNSPFLTLPRELRDMIYTYFLEAHRTAPPSPPFAGPRIHRTEKNETQAIKNIAYPISLPQSQISTLLSTHPQIRSEVLDLADKRNKITPCLPAELDIMSTGYVLYPLWTRLPTLIAPNTALNVTVNLRIFSPEAFRAQEGPPRWPCYAAGRLLTLLNQFFTCGPAFTSTRKRGSRGEVSETTTVIDTLTIRLINYDIYTPRMFPPAVHEMVRMCKALARRADARASIRRVCVVEGDAERRVMEGDAERRVMGHAEREWGYDVAGSCSENELMNLTERWAEVGFALEADEARFGVKKT
jgi:hypothetical protein